MRGRRGLRPPLACFLLFRLLPSSSRQIEAGDSLTKISADSPWNTVASKKFGSVSSRSGRETKLVSVTFLPKRVPFHKTSCQFADLAAKQKVSISPSLYSSLLLLFAR